MQVVNFGILLSVLWYILYRPITNLIESRRAQIIEGVANAERAETALRDSDAKKTDILAKASLEAEAIMTQARESAKKKEEIARQQSAKRKEEMRRAESAKKKEEIARQQSAKKKEEAMRAESAKRKQQVSRQSSSRSSPSPPRTPPQKKSPRAFFTPSSLKFTDTERAAVYGRKGNSQKMFAEIERQKMICRQRGAVYNPITKQCSFKTPAKVFSGCRIDCAKIGKKCGPRGQCIKL
jgi:F0F1-type ATP synthase membrane subunit b/b'